MQAKRSHPFLRSSQALALQIRGLPLMAMNDSKGICIAIDPQEEEESLLWCFAQIQKDCKSLKDWIKASSSKGDSKRALQIQHGLEGEFIDKALVDIGIHGACSKVRWCPSRKRFKVWKVGKQPREFTVPELNKKRKTILALKGLENHLPDADSQALASSFQTVVTKALGYLEEAAASTPNSPAAFIESDSHASTLSLGQEGLEQELEGLLRETLETRREP